ncbi:AAA family ATPase [Psychrobacillus sp. INOP01]|uniref:ParA family protein n=1 Tax=Psychrobacillus sp. INOP01 TaxID=2829187 RepID=UPI001BA78992|nr:AAA family ATPase [Psychrobacillus sp. INOP01]QUG42637.1 AAA family ATPase [Psychrobacillus sp. INOP01]
MEKNGTVISFINMKGGVGKTTLSIGIADYLAKLEDYNVLVIDIDPQFNATHSLIDAYKKKSVIDDTIIDDEKVDLRTTLEEVFLGNADDEDEDEEVSNNFYTLEVLNKNKTIFQLFKPQLDMSKRYSLPKAEDLIINLKDGLDLLCGDLNLVLANKNSDFSLVKRLKNFISESRLRKQYDYIIIDCPPTLTIYTDSALLASDFYIIPNRIDRYSIIGIDSLQTAVGNLIASEGIDLKCLGIVYTMVNKNMNTKQLKIKNDFESKKSVNDIDIFDSISHIVNHIQYGYSGTLPTKYKSSLEDIESISHEMLEKIAFTLEAVN